jgi:hypothetical protein
LFPLHLESFSLPPYILPNIFSVFFTAVLLVNFIRLIIYEEEKN